MAGAKPSKMNASLNPSPATEEKPIDGRRARSLRTRALIIDTYITLLRENQRIPTADSVAARAGLSQRGIFGHFPDLKSLGVAAFDHVVGERVRTPAGDKVNGTRTERIAFQIEVRAMNCETWLPMWRVVQRAYLSAPEIAQRIEAVRALTRTRIELMYEPELATLEPEQRMAVVAAIEALTDFETWGRLRSHYKLSYEAACAAWVEAIERLLPATPGNAR